MATALETAKRADSLASIAAAQVKAGDHGAAGETFIEALETAKRMDNAGFRAQALVSIAIAQVESGDRGAAGETLATALETAKGIDDAWPRAQTLASIAAALTAAESRRH